MWRVTEKFNAIGTSGEEYVIVELTDLPEDGAADQAAGPRRYTLEDGRDLSEEKDGTFLPLIVAEYGMRTTVCRKS